MRWMYAVLLLLITIYVSFADHVKYGEGYYYVEIKDGTFKQVNKAFDTILCDKGWEVYSTIDTAKIAHTKAYKTYLVFKSDYMIEGIDLWKDFTFIMPLKVNIYTKGTKVIISVEDVISKTEVLFKKKGHQFRELLRKIENDIYDILNDTADTFEKKRLNAYEGISF